MLAVGVIEWVGNGGSQGRRKAARLFLISPTEDMYVRELCRHNWITSFD